MQLIDLEKKYERIPNELKALKRWVCYRVEVLEDNKKTKRPYNAMSGKLARVNEELTWTNFSTALKGCVKYNMDGIGFVLGYGIFGIDLDNHKNENGEFDLPIEEFNKLAHEFVDTLDSYAEFSQSGNGVHIICQGTLPVGGRRKGCVEMYDAGRFFAFTGDVIKDVPIRNKEKEIIPLWEKYIKPQGVVEQKIERHEDPNRRVLKLSDEDIINTALNSKNGDDFYRYYNLGDLSRNNNDASSADMSFCSLLAFWCNGDKAQMDRIFRNSALYRKKWDEKRGEMTYGEITLDKACRTVCKGFEKSEIVPKFTINNKKIDEKLKEKAESNIEAEMNIDENGEPIFRIKKIFKKYPYNDTGNAYRFYDYFGDLFKYNVTDKCYMFWTGKTWIKDTTNIIRKYSNKFIEILKEEEKALENEMLSYIQNGEPNKAKLTEKILDACMKNTARVANKAGKDAMLNELQSLKDIPVESSVFNSDDYLLNTESGIVNLITGEISKFDKTKLMSKNTKIKVSYEEPTEWLKFLYSVFDNGDEIETNLIIESLQTCLGYSLTGSTKEQIMFLLHGSGSNGKSTLTEQIAHIMGDYGDNISSSVLMQQKASNNATMYSIAKLQTVRFVETGETDDGGRFAEAQVKLLTGGDSISAQYKYGNEFSYKPKFKIWMSTNNMPNIYGTDLGIWRRIFLFPFKNSFIGDKKDKNLPEKLKKESPQILGWCIKGFQKYLQLGDIIRPKSLEDAKADYRDRMDLIAQFLRKECTLGDQYETECKTLYTYYKSWAADNTEFVMKESRFNEELKKKGISIRRTAMGISYYVGLKKAGLLITGKKNEQ